MSNVVEIRDLTFKYKNKTIFENLNFKAERYKFITVLGANGSGKTTLMKLLLGEERPNSVIMLNGLSVVKDNLNNLYAMTGIVFENATELFIMDKVIDELTFPLENLQFTEKKIENNLNEVTEKLQIKDLLNRDIDTLNNSEKVLVAIAAALVLKPRLIIIDENLIHLSKDVKNRVIEVLKEKTKNKELSVLYFTHNVEDSLYADDVFVISDKKIVSYDTKEELFKDEELFKNAHLELPFMIELSNRLKFYDLIDENYLDAEKLVDDLWK